MMMNLASGSKAEKLVSIVMPVYNGEELLEETLSRLVSQDYAHLEIIICDDASTDRTQQICLDFARRDRRIRYVRNEVNLGLWPNLLRAFSLATGEYVMGVAHDDIHVQGLISTLSSELEAHPEAAMAFCAMGIVDFHGNLVSTKFDDMPYSVRSLGAFGLYRLWFSREPGVVGYSRRVDGNASGALFRRDVVAKAIRFVREKKSLTGGYDVLLPLYCLQYGDYLFRKERLFFRRLKEKVVPSGLATRQFRVSGHAGVGMWARKLVGVLRAPVFGLTYYGPQWWWIRKCIPFTELSIRQRWEIERRVVAIMAAKCLNWVGVALRQQF